MLIEFLTLICQFTISEKHETFHDEKGWFHDSENVFYVTNMLEEQFYVFITYHIKRSESKKKYMCGNCTMCTYSASNKNSFYGEMKNDKLWQMETMNWMCVYIEIHYCWCAICVLACCYKSWRRQWWWGWVRENVRMKWLYGSICNAIKWTLNMHNNPLLLSTSICQLADSFLVHTRKCHE